MATDQLEVGTYNIKALQGATFQRTLLWKDENGVANDLTGYSARMKVKESTADTVAVLSLVSPTDIVLGGVAGTVVITVDDVTMAGVEENTYVYDLELVSGGGIVTRLIGGKFQVIAEVTD